MTFLFRLRLLVFFSLTSMVLHAQEYGKASYYSNEFDGGRTFFGETYDKDQFTAAHKVHSKGTRLKVTRQDNGKSVIVRVNDRGPYVSGRIIELSYAAARQLDMIDDGLVDVRVEVVSKGAAGAPTEETSSSTRDRGSSAQATSGNTPPPGRENTTSRRESPTATSTPPPAEQRPARTTASTSTEQAAEADPPTIERRPAKERMLREPKEYGLFEINVLNVQQAGFGVQVASFSNYENTMKRLAELQGMWFDNIMVSMEKAGGNKLYKLILGPFETREKATSYLGSLRKNKKGVDGFVVDLSAINYE